jgi:hypothetical protein
LRMLDLIERMAAALSNGGYCRAFRERAADSRRTLTETMGARNVESIPR